MLTVVFSRWLPVFFFLFLPNVKLCIARNEKPNILLSQQNDIFYFYQCLYEWQSKTFNFLLLPVMFLESFLTEGTFKRSSNYFIHWLNDLLHKINRHCTGGKFLSDGRIILKTEPNVSSALGRKQMPHLSFSEVRRTKKNDQMFHTTAIGLRERH